MPYLTGAGCILDADCPAPSFPTSTANCKQEVSVGGINELYFLPCTSTFTEANVTSLTWWQGLLTAGTLGRSGIGLGSLSRKASQTQRIGSGRSEQITGLTWAIRWVYKVFDKTSGQTTAAKMDELLTGFNKYLVVARMQEGDENVIPIGMFSTSDFTVTVPDNFEDIQTAELEISWKQMGFPRPVTVAGLATILPKV